MIDKEIVYDLNQPGKTHPEVLKFLLGVMNSAFPYRAAVGQERTAILQNARIDESGKIRVQMEVEGGLLREEDFDLHLVIKVISEIRLKEVTP